MRFRHIRAIGGVSAPYLRQPLRAPHYLATPAPLHRPPKKTCMILQLGSRIAGTVDPRLLATMAWNFGFKGARSVMLFKQRLKKGIVFPPFLYLSIINSCNLRCQGCWVDVESPRNMIELDELNRLVNDAREHGNSFFGVLGGEPFLHPGLFDFLAQHPDCYFQIFTNGQMITEKVAKNLRQLGNCTDRKSVV